MPAAAAAVVVATDLSGSEVIPMRRFCEKRSVVHSPNRRNGTVPSRNSAVYHCRVPVVWVELE